MFLSALMLMRLTLFLFSYRTVAQNWRFSCSPKNNFYFWWEANGFYRFYWIIYRRPSSMWNRESINVYFYLYWAYFSLNIFFHMLCCVSFYIWQILELRWATYCFTVSLQKVWFHNFITLNVAPKLVYLNSLSAHIIFAYETCRAWP